MAGILNEYSKEALTEIVNNSFSYKEVARKIGFSNHPSGATIKNIKERLEYFKISVEHFKHLPGTKRTIENTFIKDSTVSQKQLRKIFKENNYQPYVCSICGLKPTWNNKSLTLTLDHIDGNNRNCLISNLRWVCPNCNSQLETTGFRKMRVKTIRKPKKSRRSSYCVDCGKPIYKNAKRCIECSHILERHVERPSKEILEKEIYEYSFVELGKKYGVTDNTIKKWCKAYNLPAKRSEIKKKK